MNNTKDKLSFFISYSHDDKRIKEVLLTNLKSLKATYNIEVWHDGKITAGSNINSAILKELSCSDVVLLLVTPSFIASYYCMNVELKEAIERMDKGECLVIPVICKPCALTEGLPFFQLNRVPKDGKPIAKYRSQVEGCTDATNMIKNMLESTFPNSKIRKTRGRKKQVAQLSPLTIDLYKEGKLQQIPVEQKFLDIIPEYINSIIDFNCMMPQALENSYKRFKKRYTELADKSTDNVLKLEKKELRLFLMDICGYVKKYITPELFTTLPRMWLKAT